MVNRSLGTTLRSPQAEWRPVFYWAFLGACFGVWGCGNATTPSTRNRTSHNSEPVPAADSDLSGKTLKKNKAEEPTSQTNPRMPAAEEDDLAQNSEQELASTAPLSSREQNPPPQTPAEASSFSTQSGSQNQAAAQPKPAPTMSEEDATNPPPKQPAVDQTVFRKRMETLLNQLRARGGVAAVKADSKLTQAASLHAKDMEAREYFGHASPEGTGADWRVTQQSYSYATLAENIAHGQSSATEAFSSWLNSNSHRANMVLEKHTHYGFGWAEDTKEPGHFFWVLVLASPEIPPQQLTSTKPN